jgi:hypothetical protein
VKRCGDGGVAPRRGNRREAVTASLELARVLPGVARISLPHKNSEPCTEN